MEEAKKADTNKPPIGLISRAALEQEALVMQFGAQKYDAHNWRKGMKYSRLLNAALRHILAFNEGKISIPRRVCRISLTHAAVLLS